MRQICWARVTAMNRLVILSSITMPFGLGTVSIRQVSSSGRAQAVDAAARVLQAGLALVGEVEVAFAAKTRSLTPLKAFRAGRVKEWRHRPRVRIEQHETAPVAGTKMRASRWIFNPFGQPSYSAMSSHSPLGSMRKIRPNGMSVT